jgi:hypothetical protein
MAQNQRETCIQQILDMYQGLEAMNASSELFFYRYANFVDFSYKKVCFHLIEWFKLVTWVV